MSINTVLVIEKDAKWHEIYRMMLPEHLPGAAVQTVDTLDAAVLAMTKRSFDLCITHVPYGMVTTREERIDSVRKRITTLRKADPDARIALVTGWSDLGALAKELGVSYFLKQSRTLLADIAAHYAAEGSRDYRRGG